MPLRGLGGAALGSAFMLGIAWLSALPVPVGSGAEAMIRLSWRSAGLRIEECRTLTPEEIAALPSHMRRTEECTGRNADDVLRVEIDDVTALVDTISPSGARRDRPVYVLREFPLVTGAHRVSVRFDPALAEGVAPAEEPTSLAWSGTIVLEPGQIWLVTLDEAGTELIAVDPR